MEKLEHFRHILLFEFSRGAKAAETARNVFAVYRDNDIGESTAWKWFSRFKEDDFNISDIARSGRSSGFDEDRLNTLIRNGPRQWYSRIGKCNELRPFYHRATFVFNGQGSKIGCMGTACSKPKSQKSAGGHMCISSCSSSIGSRTSTILILYCYW